MRSRSPSTSYRRDDSYRSRNRSRSRERSRSRQYLFLYNCIILGPIPVRTDVEEVAAGTTDGAGKFNI